MKSTVPIHSNRFGLICASARWTPGSPPASDHARDDVVHRGGCLDNNETINRSTAGFTLAEVLAALMFMAIVVPVAIAALRVASLSGEVAERKAAAARVADRVLNETVVTANSNPLPQRGIATENGRPFRWAVHSESWPVAVTSTSAMQVLTANVTFSAQGRDYVVRLSTLVNGS